MCYYLSFYYLYVDLLHGEESNDKGRLNIDICRMHLWLQITLKAKPG